MPSPLPMTAFFLPSGGEMIVVLLVGIMLFGRRLPDVGRTVGRTVLQLRQGFHKLKAEMDLDHDVRDVADAFRDTRRDLTEAAAVPRALTDPGRVLKDLTDETLGTAAEPVPDSLFDRDGNGS